MKFDESVFTTELEKLNTISSNLSNNIDNIRAILKSIKSDWTCGASTEFCTNLSNSIDKFEEYITEFDSSIGYLKNTVGDVKSLQDVLKALIDEI